MAQKGTRTSSWSKYVEAPSTKTPKADGVSGCIANNPGACLSDALGMFHCDLTMALMTRLPLCFLLLRVVVYWIWELGTCNCGSDKRPRVRGLTRTKLTKLLGYSATSLNEILVE